MDADKLGCESCLFWQASPGAYYGDCTLGVVYGRTAFNYKPCAYHSERGKDAAAVPDGIAMQSAAGGMTMQEWERRMTGKQP